MLLPSALNRGCESSAGPKVTRIASLRFALARRMIQMSRSLLPVFFLAKTTYRPSGDQSGTPIFAPLSQGSDD